MNYSKIEAFFKIVEFGNITKAADALYISQSTLSDRLTALENELNTTLIIRSPGVKTIQLTRKGIEFLSYASRYLELSKDIEDWKKSEFRTNINISGPHSLNTYFFNSFFKRYTDSKLFKLNISSHWNNTIYNMLETYELDLGIVSRPYNSKNIKTIKFFKEPMVLIYNSNFSDYSTLENLSELKKTNEINLDWGPDYELWRQRHFNLADISKIRVDSPELLIEFLESPMSWAAIPLCVYDNINKKNSAIKLIDVDYSLNRTIYLVMQKVLMQKVQNSNNINNFNKFLKEIDDYIIEMELKHLCIKL